MNSFVQKTLLLFMLCCMTACTYNVSMAHTSGTADDVIDDTASNSPNVSPNVTVPLTPGSEIKVTK